MAREKIYLLNGIPTSRVDLIKAAKDLGFITTGYLSSQDAASDASLLLQGNGISVKINMEAVEK